MSLVFIYKKVLFVVFLQCTHWKSEDWKKKHKVMISLRLFWFFYVSSKEFSFHFLFFKLYIVMWLWGFFCFRLCYLLNNKAITILNIWISFSNPTRLQRLEISVFSTACSEHPNTHFAPTLIPMQINHSDTHKHTHIHTLSFFFKLDRDTAMRYLHK